MTVERFIKDLELLGPCRFVVSNEYAILEAVGVFERYRTNDKMLATVSNDNNSFECHLRLQDIAGAEFVTKDRPGGSALNIIRLQDKKGKSLLSAILAGEDGEPPEPDAITFWESLRDRFGANVKFE